jgi:acetyltransferase-like isoleucine patch superfamily enzyme
LCSRQQIASSPSSGSPLIGWHDAGLFSLRTSDLAPNLLLGSDVTIAEDVEIGPNVVIHDGVTVEAGARLEHGVVLGRVPRLGLRSKAAPSPPGPTLIGPGAIICPYVVVDATVWIGPDAFLGDRASLRAGVRVGAEASIGSAAVLNRDVEIGDRARTLNGCAIGARVVVEPDAFLGPHVQILSGRTMGSLARRSAPILRRGCQVGSGATILPGVEVGEQAVIGAGSVVSGDVAAATTVVGVPARPRGS